jgi:hypothetical protein
MNDLESWYISQLVDSRFHQRVNKAMQEEKAAMQRKKEFYQHTNETINNWVTEMKEHATAQEKQPLGALGRACLMFKILTNIDMTEQQAEKFLDLVKVCEGHTND